MDKAKQFLKLLRGLGYDVNCMRQLGRGDGRIEIYSVAQSGRVSLIILQLFEHGFNHFIQGKEVDIIHAAHEVEEAIFRKEATNE